MDQPELNALPSGLIDALLRFAMDPGQWDSFARELDARGHALSRTNPTKFLAALSQAESLAWQIRNEPQSDLHGCAYFLLGAEDQVLQKNAAADTLEDYCRVHDGRLVFTEQSSRHNFDNAVQTLQESGDIQVLVELCDPQSHSRFGYLVTADYLPAALSYDSTGNDHIRYGLLIAEQENGEKIRRIMQSSFRLTTAETAICQRLRAGLQLKEAAQSLNISTNTARNHLQSVFDKTGINRQSDLILMMTQLSVIVGVLGDIDHHPEGKQHYSGHHFVIVGEESGTPRRIAYRRYGTGGRVLVYFHESAGTSRLPPGTDVLARELGLTIIAPERPGSGFSDPLDHYGFDHTAQDTVSLLHDLRATEVHLLGFVSGAGHALAAAARLSDPSAGIRLHSVTLVSGRAPAPFPRAESSPLAVLRRRLIEQPWLLATFFNIVKNRANSQLVGRVIMSIYGAAECDRSFLEQHPEVLEHLVGSALENLTVSGAGVVGEIRCFANADPVDLRTIAAPVSLWHGAEDTLSDYMTLQEAMAGVNYTEHLFADAGTMLLFQQWPTILKSIATH